MILTSKLMISFIHNNTLKIKSQPIVCYSMEVIIYIGLWALEVKCTQYGIYEEVVFKNASAMIFLKSGRTGSNFRLDSEILRKTLRPCPTGSDTPESSWGCLTSSNIYKMAYNTRYNI